MNQRTFAIIGSLILTAGFPPLSHFAHGATPAQATPQESVPAASVAMVNKAPGGGETRLTDKFCLWSNGTQLRGANIYQRVVYPNVYDDPAAWGNGPFGLVFTQQDFDALSAAGANLVVLSHPGLYDDKPPYAFNQSAQDNLDKFIDMAKKANLFVVIVARTGPGRSELEIWASTTTGTAFEKSHINDNVWTDKNAQDKWVEMWRYTAARYRNSPVVVGYELMVEPDPNAFWLHTYEPSDFYPTYANTTYDWNQLYPRISAAIREVDKETPILIGGMNWSGVGWLSSLKPTGDKRTVYIIHQYEPQVQYTHQEYSVTPKMLGYPGKLNWDGNDVPFNSTWFDAWLSPVDKFKSDYRSPVAVTEYGAARWVPGGAQYLDDEMARFEKSGMNYAVWSWQPSLNAHTMEQNDFNVRMGPDPANITEGNSEIYGALKKYWAKNVVRPTPTSTPKNLIVSMNLRAVHSSPVLGGKPSIEMVVWARNGFPVRNEIAVLRIGKKEFTRSRYPDNGDTHTLIFTLTTEEFAQTATGDPVTVQYGSGGESGERWNFGTLDKSLLKQSNESKTLIYHGVSTHSWSNLVTPGGNQAENIKSEVNAYEAAVGRTVAWVAFGHEWKSDGPTFPTAVATSIKNRGATPFIFLNLRSVDVGQPDPLYSLAAIISGKFDSDLAAWADAAKNFGSELIVDWGWEMNGDFTPWNGSHNGGNTGGPKNYREAYRHIIKLMRSRGATNIRWAFHINFPEFPDKPWNTFENYYPGDDVIDMIGASIYSAQFPTDEFFPSFESLFDQAYSRFAKMAPQKPVYVFEFGAAAHNPLGDSAVWADRALADILSGRWPAVRGFAWWNDFWSQDANPAHDTEIRVEKLPALAKVFQSRLSAANNIGDRSPILSTSIASSTSVESRPLKTIAANRGIRFGANYDSALRSGTHDSLFEQEMNTMTAGTFWDDGSSKSRTEFDFSEMDAKVKWGRAHGMELHGHVLVWFDETTMADWVKAAPTADMEAIMNERIDSLVGRYAGQIKVWDVVNEAVNEEGNLRQNHKWAEAMGNDYIRKAFVRAHAADPTAVLRYNEYNIESNTAKFEGVKNLLIKLKNESTPVHALGWQMHVTPESFNPATLLARMNEIADLGFDNYVTELDVELPENATAADYEKQKQTYKTVVQTVLAARRLKSIVIWGLRDGSPHWLTKNHPLLFDENFNKKPAYFGVLEALAGK